MSESAWTPAVYEELRRMADAVMSGEREGHTLGATALTHEVWLRVRASRNAQELDRGAFLGVAAQAMRRILVEHARRRASDKRGGDARRTTLDGKCVAPAPEELALDMEAALVALEATDPELARLVELRFFGGSSNEDIAALLGTSVRTVKRRWRYARAWLEQRMVEKQL